MSTSNLTIDRLYRVTFKQDDDETAGHFLVIGKSLVDAQIKADRWAKGYYDQTPVRIFSIIEQDEEIIQ